MYEPVHLKTVLWCIRSTSNFYHYEELHKLVLNSVILKLYLYFSEVVYDLLLSVSHTVLATRCEGEDNVFSDFCLFFLFYVQSSTVFQPVHVLFETFL